MFRKIVVFLFLFLSHTSYSQQTWDVDLKIPELRHAVMDEARLLNSKEKNIINNLLQSLYSNTETQIAVLILADIKQYPIEQVSLSVAEKWKLGKEKTDRGLLLLVALKQRKMRIEVGQGLEGQITDLNASRIINEVLRPSFKVQQYGQGILYSVASIIEKAEPEFYKRVLENKVGKPIRKKQSKSFSIIKLIILMIFILFFGPLAFLTRGNRYSHYGNGGWGSSGGGFGGGGFGGGGGFSGGGGGFSGGGASGGW